MEDVKYMTVPAAAFRLGADRLPVLPDLVGIRCPDIGAIGNDLFRYILIHNAFHHLVYHLLLLLRIRHVGIVGLDLIPEVPVREQPHPVREELASVLGHKFVHHDVISRDIVLCGAGGLRHQPRHLGRHPGRETVPHPGICPLETAPVPAEPVLLLEREFRKVEHGDERQFVGIEIVGKMVVRAEGAEYVVHFPRFRA